MRLAATALQARWRRCTTVTGACCGPWTLGRLPPRSGWRCGGLHMTCSTMWRWVVPHACVSEKVWSATLLGLHVALPAAACCHAALSCPCFPSGNRSEARIPTLRCPVRFIRCAAPPAGGCFPRWARWRSHSLCDQCPHRGARLLHGSARRLWWARCARCRLQALHPSSCAGPLCSLHCLAAGPLR